MPEATTPLEKRRPVESVERPPEDWMKYLALTTALIAVAAGIASPVSGTYANRGLLEKNEAAQAQSQASDEWNYYQAKGFRKDLADGLYAQSQNVKFRDNAEQYGREQDEIMSKAQNLAQKVTESNSRAEAHFERHRHIAMGITFLHLAIALSAVAALLRNKVFWGLSVTMAGVGAVYFVTGAM